LGSFVGQTASSFTLMRLKRLEKFLLTWTI
jgi:hypothetical protein